MNKKMLVITFCVIAAVCLYMTVLAEYLTIEYLKSYQAEYSAYYQKNPITSLFTYTGLFILCTIISIPATAFLTIAAGALFGFIPGVLISMFSALSGAALAFLLARYVLGEALQRKYCDQLRTVNDGIEKEGAFYLFSLRVMPIMPFCVINFVMGLTRMKLLQYLVVTLIGITSWILIYVYAGTTLRNIRAIEDIISFEVFAALMLLGCFPLVMRRVIPAITAKFEKKSTKIKSELA